MYFDKAVECWCFEFLKDIVNSLTLQQLRFHSVSRFFDAKMRFSPKKGNAFLVSPGTLWNANWNAFGTRSERKWNENAVLGFF